MERATKDDHAVEPDDEGDGRPRLDRRKLIGLGTAAAAGAAAAIVGGADPAGATTGTMQYGTTNNSGVDQTSLVTTTSATGFLVLNSGAGAGVFGQGATTGVMGRSTSPGGTAVWGESTAGPCVVGNTQTGGPAVRATIGATPTGPLNPNPAVEVNHQGTGAGIVVNHQGLGTGVGVSIGDPSNSSDAISAFTPGAGRAVSAQAGTNIAVYGLNGGAAPLIVTDVAGVKGESTGATGVVGTSDAAVGVRGVVGDVSGLILNAGVVGEGNSTFGGVIGVSADGTGVQAISSTGTGINTSTAGGTALVATTTNVANANPAIQAQSLGKGAAILATTTSAATTPAIRATSNSPNPAVNAIGKVVPANGTSVLVAGNAAALKVNGVSTFTRSGVAHITGTTLAVDVPGGLSSASHVLATMQTTTAASVSVKSATPSTATGKVTITLTAAAPAGGVDVAWLVFG